MKTFKLSFLTIVFPVAMSMVSSFSIARASTLHVSTTGNDANSGTDTAPLRNIQTALSRAVSGDLIKVAAGTYSEGLIPQSKVTLLGGYSSTFSDRDIFSNKTVIRAVSSIMLTDTHGCTIDGFVFDGNNVASTGLDLRANSSVTHNIILRVKGSPGYGADISGAVFFANNTVYNNVRGILIFGGQSSSATVKNNIVTNHSFGINNSSANGIHRYNCVFGNSFNYVGNFDFPGVGDISLNPQYQNAAGDDFRVLNTSPTIDAGDPNDSVGSEPEPNGGRIDMGVYGGTSNATSAAQNQPPVVANAISDQILQVGGSSFTRNLNTAPAVFSDPDGDPLTYTASSSATNIATAGISGTTLTVTPVAGGSATITVTANDGRGGTVSTSFTATVNRPPTVANSIPNQTLTVGGSSFTRNLNTAPAVFNDPDGDALSYTASSSSSSIATAGISGSTLTVTPVAGGNATITVTANDGKGGTVSTTFTATVNRPPTVTNAIPNQTLQVGGSSFTRNLTAAPVVFTDPDGDALSFTASSSASGIATASISGSTLTVTPVAGGSATITVTANDGKGGTVSTSFTATVNRPPTVANTIPNQTLTVGGSSFTRNLNTAPAVFSDPDGDALSYTASSSSSSITTASISGSTLTVTPVAGGSATITVTANDGKGGTVSTSFTATVNRPPVVANTISNQTLQVGGSSFTRDLNAAPTVFNDPDGDALSYTASSSASGIATAGISGSTLTVTPVAGGSATITVTANDGKGGTVSTSFTATVNRPPVVANTISNQTLTVGGSSFTRNLNTAPAVFSDPDGDALSYTASSSSSSIATASISGSTLTVTPVAGGSATITVTANDGKGGTVSTSFTATVNRPPVVANTISNQTLQVGGSSFTRDLNAAPTVFNDPDGDALSYTASSTASGIAPASISGSTLMVTPVAGGSATITVTANDGKGGTVSTSFSVTVNRPPTVANTIPNQTLTVGGSSFTRNLNASPAVFNDPDGDALSYTASSSASNIATASISGSTLTVTPVADGSATITVTANDGKGGTVSTTFTATVVSANQPPIVANAIPNQTLTVGGSSFTRNLNASPAVFNDPDGDALSYTASSSASNIATASISGSTLTVTPVAGGSATITVTANDGRGGTVSTTFTATVNRPPTVANIIPNQTLTIGGSSFTRNLNTAPAVFSDPDGDALSYTASSSAAGIATAGISGSTLTVTPVAGGSATITVTANDGKGGTVSTSFSVTVNRPPVVASTISNQTLQVGGASFTRNLNASPAVFSDPDGDALSYTASSSASGIAMAGISGSTLTVTPVAGGSAMITVTANDGRGGAVATTFTVTVNRPPVVASAIPNQTLTAGGPSFTRDLNASPSVFTDPDGDTLTYVASSNATNIATASIAGSTLTIAPVAVGNATITVTANDGKGGTAPTTFTVTVGTASNRPPTVANAISSQNLTLGGAAFTRDLNAAPAVFNDPDGDVLTYTANSSAINFATASISGSTLTVAPAARGSATITVTANDNRGGMVAATFTVTVTGNRPPVVVNAISNQTLTVGSAAFTRNLTAAPMVFSDPDGDALTFTASSNATSIATTNISGNILTVASVAAGNATITVTANDGQGGTTSTTFTVTVVAANRPPVVANAISNQTLTAGGASLMRDLNAAPAVFSDPDNDALTYTVSSSATNIATANISGSTLTVASVAVGSATITVTANDGRGGTVSTTFTVTVVTANRPPVVANAISSQTLTAGGASFTRDLNASPAVFSDPDGDALTYTTSSNATNIATTSISGSTLAVAPVAVGSATITVTANDGRGGTVSTTFNVTVGTVSNRPPVVANAISNQNLTAGGASFTRDLNASPTVFNDPDGDALTYTASSSAANIATADISSSTLTVAPVAAGNATITVTANDGRGGTVSTTFTVTVGAAPNRAPTVVNAISNQTLTVGGASFTRDLNASPAVFSDPDGDALTYTASSNATNIATTSISGSTLAVAPVAVGSATITVTANDGRGGTASTTFVVTVGTISNRPPVVANVISNQTLTAGGASFTRDLNAAPAVFNDPDGDALTYTANSSAANIATASISSSTLTVAPIAAGSATITVTANDGRGGTVSTTFTVTVGAAPNRAPTVANAISNQTLTLGGSSFMRDLNAAPAVFNDLDGDALTYSANSSATNIATASISGSTLTVAPVALGSATITVTANDGRGGTASTTFMVTVGTVSNRPPVVANVISNQTLTAGGASFTRDLNTAPAVFSDPDSDTLTYTASSSATNIAMVNISGSMLTVAPVAAGNATITVAANDSKGGAVSTTFTVTVSPAANRPPVVANAISNQTLTVGGASFVRDLNAALAVFSDPMATR